ncbi:hypothetical protein ACIQ4I_13125 [Rummeliibacillus sp. NPDC094406]|uniref:hypothetical protein n=1 Tax=Rummeliibacillus sp. NPDC094406 TaxID=3364511 RepID=UPI0038166663
MKEQLNDKAKRFFEYLLALSSLNGKPIHSIQDYEKTWIWDELGEVEGCTIGNRCGRPSNLLEIHKPTIDHALLKSPSPYPELDKWMIDADYKKESSTPSYKHTLKVNETVFHVGENEENIKLDSQRLSEWKVWIERKNRLARAQNLYAELLELIDRLEQESDSIELVLSKGLLKWSGADGGETIELPLFTTNVMFTLHAESDLITLKEETKGLKFENELFSGKTLLNREQIDILIDNIENFSFSDDLSSELKQLVHLLDPNGRFIENSNVETSDNHAPVIINQSLLIVRAKSSGIIRNDLQQIISAIDQNKIELPDSIHAILGDIPKQHHPNSINKSNLLKSTLPNQVFFPLNANEQQKEIVKRIEQNNGVKVHVSSETEKTHTIANLISHYLAEGKKILITTQEDSQLSELKNKIPEEIRDLCVPYLSEETNAFNEIEQSIRLIGEKLEALDLQKLKENIEQNQQLLNQSIQNEAEYRNSLKQYAKSEGTPILYGDQQLFKYDVAKRLAETDVHYQWIKDDLPLIMKFPLNQDEWEEFCTLQNSFKKEDYALIDTILPTNSDILNESTFKALLEEEKQLVDEIDLQYIMPIERTPEKKSTLLIMKALVEEIIAKHHLVEDENFSNFIQDLLSSEKRRAFWVQLVNELKQHTEIALALYHELIHHKIMLPKKLNSEIQLDLIIARERILSGKKPNRLFFLRKGKTTQYLFQTAVLDGKPLKKLEDVTTIQKHLEYRNLITKLSRLFNGNMNEMGIPGVDITWQDFPQILEERIEVLSQIIDLVDLDYELSSKLQIEQLQLSNIFDFAYYENLKREIEHTLNYIRLERWQEKYDVEIEKLAALVNSENMHAIVKQFLYAMQVKDDDAWKALIGELKELHKVDKKITKWKKFTDQLEYKLPLTVEGLNKNFGEVKLEKDQYIEAFVLKKMETWVNEDSDTNCNALNELLQNELNTQKKYIREIVTDATWATQLARITDEEKEALSAWKSYSQKIEKDEGKYTTRLNRETRKAVKRAQSSIPVWMMPIDQVIQNFPITNEKFDVIIIDESSKCDLFTINALLRGEKVIVVGDSEQTNPLVIGANREAVAELMHNYIQDVPNRSLFDGEISLYEIAEQNFPSVEIAELMEEDLLNESQNPKNEMGQIEDLESLCESAFEIDVLNMILSKDYRVTPKVKVGPTKIDFVIEGLHDRLAVECDGEKWKGPEKFEEYQQRQGTLEQAGWRFWHVNGRDFYCNQKKVMEGLWSKLSDLGILPIGAEETSKVLHDFSVNMMTEQAPKIHFQTQNKKIPTKPVKENKLSDQFTTEKITDENHSFIEEYKKVVKKLAIKEDLPKNPTLIYTNKEKNESKIVSASTINDIPPELIQNVLIQGKISIVKFLNDLGFEIVDYRLQDGSLWVVANEEIKPFMEKLEACNVSFRYISKGSQTTKGHPAWYTKILD